MAQAQQSAKSSVLLAATHNILCSQPAKLVTFVPYSVCSFAVFPPFFLFHQRYIPRHPIHSSKHATRMNFDPILMSDSDGTTDTVLKPKTKPKTERPPLYKVLLLNDDYTPMEFVVHVLEKFFGIRHQAAVELMLTVHKKGVAVVGVFSHEIAETKVMQVMDCARQHQHPLQCTMEKE